MESKSSKDCLNILFISNVPSSNIGQIYRVKNVAEALEKIGWKTFYFHSQNNETIKILKFCDIVVVFRTGWDPILEAITKTCHIRNIPLVYDVDDIIFEPDAMVPKLFSLLNNLPNTERIKWQEISKKQNLMLINSDAAILSTESLAKVASKYCKNTFVLPNTLNEAMLNLALIASLRKKPSLEDGFLRIGFAGGNDTHQENFRVIEKPISKILSTNPMVRLVIVGPLDISKYSFMTPFINQIETRPKVLLNELFIELHRFDINLAPLEVGNPFCETKSELRFLQAAAVTVPTIASPAIPLKKAIIDNQTGLIAHNEEEWITKTNLLINNAEIRLKIGKTAKVDAIKKFGPESLIKMVEKIYYQII